MDEHATVYTIQDAAQKDVSAPESARTAVDAALLVDERRDVGGPDTQIVVTKNGAVITEDQLLTGEQAQIEEAAASVRPDA